MNLMDNGTKMGSTTISSSVSITPAPPLIQNNIDQANKLIVSI